MGRELTVCLLSNTSYPGRRCPCMVLRGRRKEILTIAGAPFQILPRATEAHISVQRHTSVCTRDTVSNSCGGLPSVSHARWHCCLGCPSQRSLAMRQLDGEVGFLAEVTSEQPRARRPQGLNSDVTFTPLQWSGMSGCRPCSRRWLSIEPMFGSLVPLCWEFEAQSSLTVLVAWSYEASRISFMWLWLGTKYSSIRIWRYEGLY